MPICFCACVCVCVFRHARLPSYVPACLGSCLDVCMNGSTGQRSIQSTDCLHLCQFHLGNWLATIDCVPVTTAFLFAGRWCTATGGSISVNSYHSQNENMSGLKSACSNQIRQRKCSVFVCFRVSLCHNTLCAYTDVEHIWDCVYWHSLCGVNQTCWTIGSWRCCLCLNFVSSITAGSATICRLLCGLKAVSRSQRKTTRIFMYVCVRACMCTCIYACLHVCLHARLACVYCGIVQYLRWGE